MRHKLFSRAFTIVELLVVIVIIGILATVVITAFNGISGRAKDAALSSDLTQAKKQIEAFYAVNGVYPTANNCTNTAATEICLKTSPGNTLTYTFVSNTASPAYTLTGAITGVAVDPSVAIFNFDAVNGSTTITDSSPVANNWTAGGSAVISTSVKKFGTGSLYLNGVAGSKIYSTNAVLSIGTGDFTIEMWIYPLTVGQVGPWSNSGLATNMNGWIAAPSISFSLNGTNKLFFAQEANGTNMVGTTSVALNTWSHVALSRSGTTIKMFLNGTQEGSLADSRDYSGFNYWMIGTFTWGGAGEQPLNGYIDGVRITKGLARYTGNFTPPTTAF